MFLGYFKNEKKAQKAFSWDIADFPLHVGKEANKALETFSDDLASDEEETEAGQELKDSLEEAIAKAKLSKAVESMVNTTNLRKKKKKKK